MTNAWEILTEFSDSAMKNARGLPEQEQDKVIWTGIGFRLGQQKMIVPITEVEEIMTVPKCTLIPGSKKYVTGLANVRGRLVPVLDLSRMLKLKSKSTFRKKRAFLIEFESIVTGLIVDEILGMRHFDRNLYLPEVPGECEEIAQFSRGMFVDESGIEWPIFSTWYLSKDEKFKHVAV